MIKINLKNFPEGPVAERLSKILGFEVSDHGIEVSAIKGERIGLSYSGERAVVYYKEKHQLFRGLGLLCEAMKAKKSEIDISEDSYFKTLGAMIDVSRCAVPTLKTVYETIDYMALMGYNMFMLYTEDMFELDGRPFFGYLRGRYSESDLKAIDDYAYAYGIEVIPCIECYGHMEKYLSWAEAAPVKDTDRILLAREEKTFELVEDMIRTVSSCFRTNKIHIGMDEADNMGRGKFLNRNGYVPPFDIFNEYMERLVSITDKYGLKPMMWSDMYFRICNNGSYSGAVNDVPPEVAAKIPKNITLVYWNYGEIPKADKAMLERHAKLERPIMLAGGIWNWVGHAPENNFAYENTEFSFASCREAGVRDVMTTAWFDDNAESPYFTILYGLSYTAELAYDKSLTKEKLASRFEACTGASAEAFLAMSDYHNDFSKVKSFEKYHERFVGKHVFWNDLLEGIFDPQLVGSDIVAHYAASAQKMKKLADERESDRFNYLYRIYEITFDYLAKKSLVMNTLTPAYKSGDKDTLRELCAVLIPSLKESAENLREAYRSAWFKELKTFGWIRMDSRYAGISARCDTAIFLIEAYLSGEIDKIETLDVERLTVFMNAYDKYNKIHAPYFV